MPLVGAVLGAGFLVYDDARHHRGGFHFGAMPPVSILNPTANNDSGVDITYFAAGHMICTMLVVFGLALGILYRHQFRWAKWAIPATLAVTTIEGVSLHTTPVHRRALLRGALLATAAVTAAAGLAACSSGGSSGKTVAAAQSAASRIANAASSGAASVSSNPTTSSDGGGNGGSDTSTSCNLVSKQQLASILHHAVTDVSSVAGGCIATDASDPSHAYSFGVHHDAGCWSRATSYSSTRVPGIGDAAVGSGLGLEVKHGSTCISVGGGTAAETSGDFSADIAVARIILGKLG